MVSEEDTKNGYTKETVEGGNLKITVLKTGRTVIFEEPGFDKRDEVYSIVRKLVNSVDSKDIKKKKEEIAKMKKISMEELHKEMEKGELDGDFADELECMVRDNNMKLLTEDKDYMMSVIGVAMNKDRSDWAEIEKQLKLSEGKVLYDAALSYLIEMFQDMQGDRKK